VRGTDNLRDLGWIILKWIFRKQNEKAWTGVAEETDKREYVMDIVTYFRAAQNDMNFMTR